MERRADAAKDIRGMRLSSILKILGVGKVLHLAGFKKVRHGSHAYAALKTE